MSGETVKIRASGGGEFDCYVSLPKGNAATPAMVLASAVHGVDTDIRAIADEFAANGYVVAAPDLFWRWLPGPLSHDDERARERSQPRLEKLKSNESDLTDTLAHLRGLPQFNGKAAVMGFCYGGPFAILGPKRLGFAAGISCHGTRMIDFVKDIDGVHAPVCIIWGDRDHAAPAETLDAYRAIPSRMKNVEVHIFPGVLHGFMMPAAHEAFDKKTRDFAMARANAILDGLRSEAEIRQAS
jgi:carboxymethylenebutenolidase